MKAFKLQYKDGTYEVVVAKDSLEVVKKYDLATRKHLGTRIIELQGEEKEVAVKSWLNQI